MALNTGTGSATGNDELSSDLTLKYNLNLKLRQWQADPGASEWQPDPATGSDWLTGTASQCSSHWQWQTGTVSASHWQR